MVVRAHTQVAAREVLVALQDSSWAAFLTVAENRNSSNNSRRVSNPAAVSWASLEVIMALR